MASKVDGVYGMRGSLASNVTELLGKAAHGKGVYLKNDEDGLKVDIYSVICNSSLWKIISSYPFRSVS